MVKRLHIDIFFIMSSSRVNRTPAPLTANEKWMVLNVYRYFSGATSIDKQNKNMTLRKRVGLVLGVAESTVGGCIVWLEPAQRWHIYTTSKPKSQPGEGITSLLRTHIMNSNKTGQQLSYDNFFPNIGIYFPSGNFSEYYSVEIAK